MGWKLRERWNRWLKRRGGLPSRLFSLVMGSFESSGAAQLAGKLQKLQLRTHRLTEFRRFSAARRRAGGNRPRSPGGVRRLDFGIANFGICNFLAESMRYSSTSPGWNRLYGLRLGEPVFRYAASSGKPQQSPGWSRSDVYGPNAKSGESWQNRASRTPSIAMIWRPRAFGIEGR